ncbi:hypothetical protein PFISCL1PPCAC_22030, partial [Pristionchus fissidentatus]
GSEYRVSQDIEGMEGVEEDERIEEQEEDEERKENNRYAIVEIDCLLSLFDRCRGCGARLDTSSVAVARVGSASIVTYECLGCTANGRWESQFKVGSGKGKVYSLNHWIPIGAFITGTPLPRLIDMAKEIDIAFPSDRSMRKVIRDTGAVAIDRVYESWQRDAREVALSAAKEEGLTVSIDGQYDCPGFNAPNCKVTVIDCETKLALSSSTVHKHEPGIVFLDWWHVQRPLRKEWFKVIKSNPTMTPIYRSFFNHLYFAHHKYPNKADRPRALELVRSFLKHIQGQHSWAKVNRRMQKV